MKKFFYISGYILVIVSALRSLFALNTNEATIFDAIWLVTVVVFIFGHISVLLPADNN
ncbi:hypothetical protein [Gottfriedia solisilvae]|uniref:hypothetical protein n=1 Tax=Gottfriedia solisilvae TaxID=1516104 RepID=UPI003D2EF144